MELNKFNINNSSEITELTTSNINIKIFEQITEIIKITFKRLGINPEGMSIYYQRYSNSTSILAIKVSPGDDKAIENYMFNGCNVEYYKDSLSCDVYLHSKAKSGQKSMQIANLITEDIIDFFNQIEKDLLNNNLTNLELFLRIPLSIEKQQTQTKRESFTRKLVRNIFKNK